MALPIPGENDIPKNAIVHGACGSWWTGNERSHCGGSVVFAFPLRDCDPRLASESDTSALESAPNRCGIESHGTSDLVSAHPGAVQAASLGSVDTAVASAMLIGGDWHKVGWAVVGLDVIRVVDVLAVTSHRASGDPVLVCLDVLVRADLPSQSDVAMRGQIARRFSLGKRFSGSEVPGLADLRLVSRCSAVGAAASLTGGVGNGGPAVYARDGEFPHEPMVVAIADCHRTFSSLTSFDRHRKGGHCQPPESVGLVAREKPYGTLWGLPAPVGGYAGLRAHDSAEEAA